MGDANQCMATSTTRYLQKKPTLPKFTQWILSRAGDALKMFYQEFGVPDALTFMVIRNRRVRGPHL